MTREDLCLLECLDSDTRRIRRRVTRDPVPLLGGIRDGPVTPEESGATSVRVREPRLGGRLPSPKGTRVRERTTVARLPPVRREGVQGTDGPFGDPN